MNNKEATTTEFDEAIVSLSSDIETAIARSVSHNESVDVSIDGSILSFTDAHRILFRHDDDFDYALETPRMEDVWGVKGGEDFRLKLYVA